MAINVGGTEHEVHINDECNVNNELKVAQGVPIPEVRVESKADDDWRPKGHPQEKEHDKKVPCILLMRHQKTTPQNLRRM